MEFWEQGKEFEKEQECAWERLEGGKEKGTWCGYILISHKNSWWGHSDFYSLYKTNRYFSNILYLNLEYVNETFVLVLMRIDSKYPFYVQKNFF